MRLEFEPQVTDLPLVENESFDELTVASDFQTILRTGIAAAQSGDRSKARVLLVKAAAYEPRSEDAWMWLASISEYPEELLAFLNNVLNINPDNERALEWRSATKALLAKTLVQRGVSSHNGGNDTLALQCFDQALVHDADCEMAWFWKASLAPDDQQQVEFLDKVLSLNPENQDAKNALDGLAKARAHAAVGEAKAVAVAGNSTLALEMLERALAIAPENADGWLLRSHLSSGIQDKLDALSMALEYDPNNAAARSSYEFLSSTLQPTSPTAETPVDAPCPALESAEERKEETTDSGPTIEDKTEDLTLATAVTEDHETEQLLADDGDVSADDYAYTQTVVVQASGAYEPVQETNEAEPGFISSATLGQKEMDEADPIHVTEEPVESPRSVEELFGPVEDQIDADRDTVESLSPWDSVAETDSDEAADLQYAFDETVSPDRSDYDALEAAESQTAAPVHAADSSNGHHAVEEAQFSPTNDEPTEVFTRESLEIHETPGSNLAACPFCRETNEPQAFECGSCHATLLLSDIESLLANAQCDREVIRNSVTQMEAEWNLREFDQKEMTALALGHFNLRHYETAMNYLQEASRLNPNDVILAGHLNTLAIRLAEIRRQDESSVPMSKGKTILVVDDSATVRKLISGKLEKAGHSVVCAEDGVDGLARIDEHIPDLVLLDITMPRMDGYEVCKQIRANAAAKHIPVVMISGKDGFFDKVRGRMAGTTGYITKPFGPETLMKALETYLVTEKSAAVE